VLLENDPFPAADADPASSAAPHLPRTAARPASGPRFREHTFRSGRRNLDIGSRPLRSPFVRAKFPAVGTRFENAVHRGPGPDHAREQRTVLDNRRMARPQHQRATVTVVLMPAVRSIQWSTRAKTARRVPTRPAGVTHRAESGLALVLTSVDGRHDGRWPHLVARLGRGQPDNLPLLHALLGQFPLDDPQPACRNGSGALD
jgi:hypothetical protein